MHAVPVTLLDAELPVTKCSKFYYIQEQIVMFINCLCKFIMHQCPGVGGGGGWGGVLPLYDIYRYVWSEIEYGF